MTKLQEKLIELDGLKTAQKAAFDAHPDVTAIPADKLTEIKSRNEQIATLQTEVKQLEEIEAMKSNAITYSHSGTPSTKADNTIPAPTIEFSRVSKVKNFKGTVAGKSADERAYRFGKWFKGAVVGDPSSKAWCDQNGIQTKALSEGTNYLGGYLVPPEFSTDIIDLRETYGVARQVARVVPMSSDTLTIPRRVGGLTAYFVGEAATITNSDKTWDQINLVAKKLAALTLWSSELNEDAMISIGDDLAGEIAYAFSQKEDECYFNGDGTSTYGGITGVRSKLRNVDSTISNIKGLQVATGNAYSEIVLSDFHGVMGRLPLYARNGAVWIMSATFFDTVPHKLQVAAGGNTVIDIANGGVQRFLGYPVVLSQVMPTNEANSQICALLGNFRLGSTFGDRRLLSLALSSEYKFAEDQLAIRGTERFDINVHDVGNTTAAGPIVGLITAAA
jgi:HK97 family phage major capsid protein